MDLGYRGPARYRIIIRGKMGPPCSQADQRGAPRLHVYDRGDGNFESVMEVDIVEPKYLTAIERSLEALKLPVLDVEVVED